MKIFPFKLRGKGWSDDTAGKTYGLYVVNPCLIPASYMIYQAMPEMIPKLVVRSNP